MTDHVASIDGGGTKTQVAWADRAGRVTRPAPLPGCNPQDNPDWAATLRAAIASLPEGTRALAVGMPGEGEVAALDAQVAAFLRTEFAGPVEILNDVALALYGAFGGGDGVLVLSGTGSMAMANGPAGRHIRAGGWGDLLGDEGSAFHIGQTALHVAARMTDGREPDTGFVTRLRDTAGIAGSGAFAILDWTVAQPHPRSAIAGLARVIDSLAEDGVPEAVAILLDAAGELALLHQTAARRAGLSRGAPWARAGSVMNSRILSEDLIRRIGSDPVPRQLDANGGGLLLAARLAGWPADAGWRAAVGG